MQQSDEIQDSVIVLETLACITNNKVPNILNSCGVIKNADITMTKHQVHSTPGRLCAGEISLCRSPTGWFRPIWLPETLVLCDIIPCCTARQTRKRTGFFRASGNLFENSEAFQSIFVSNKAFEQHTKSTPNWRWQLENRKTQFGGWSERWKWTCHSSRTGAGVSLTDIIFIFRSISVRNE